MDMRSADGAEAQDNIGVVAAVDELAEQRQGDIHNCSHRQHKQNSLHKRKTVPFSELF